MSTSLTMRKRLTVRKREALWKIMRHYGVPEKTCSPNSYHIPRHEMQSYPCWSDIWQFRSQNRSSVRMFAVAIFLPPCYRLDSEDCHIRQESWNTVDKKTELMKINTTAQIPVTVGDKSIKEAESFIFLGSVVNRLGGNWDSDIKSRIGKGRTAFSMLKNIWTSKKIYKLRILNSNAKSISLYGAETLRTTKTSL